MNNENSTIRSLHELKTLFDSGAITSEEYEALKKRIIFGTSTASESQSPEPIPPASPQSVRPFETKVIYPNSTGPEITEPPVTEPPIVEQSAPDYDEKSVAGVRPAPNKDWLLISLSVLGAILLLGLLAYQFLNKSNSEGLTSKSGPETEEVIPTGPGAEETPKQIPDTTSLRSDRIPMAGSDTTAATNIQEPAISSAEPTAETANPASTGLITDKEEIIRKAQQQLIAYYSDIEAAPFEASNYFAPQVNRYYTLTNTNPSAINQSVNSYHFPEFLNGKTNIQEGSMEVVNIGNGSYELTFLENGSAFRKSKNQKQETKAAVRVRFNPDFKITFFRQEQLLENRFITE